MLGAAALAPRLAPCVLTSTSRPWMREYFIHQDVQSVKNLLVIIYGIRDTQHLHTRAEPSFGLLAITRTFVPLSRFPHLVRLLDDGSDLFISHRAAERVRPRNGSEGRRTFRRSATLLISPLLPIPRGLISQGAYGRIGRSRKNQTKSILPNNKQCDAKWAVPSFGG